MLEVHQKVLTALEKDIKRRYISISKLQSDGRLELDKTCLAILNPKHDEEFTIIDDNSSIIIVRNPSEEHKNYIFGTAKFDEKRQRLRLNQKASRILLTCSVGIRAFKYNDEIALEAEPYIEPIEDLASRNIGSIDDLAPFILRSSRSILHIDVFNSKQRIKHSGTTFRILGEYWLEQFHQNLTDVEFKLIRCKNNNDCSLCKETVNNPIMKTILWFPIVAYEHRMYPRPGLLSFYRNNSVGVCADLIDKCERWRKYSSNVEQYFKKGIVDYHGENLYKIFTNDEGFVEITDISEVYPQYTSLTAEEKGLMRLALKELESFILNYHK